MSDVVDVTGLVPAVEAILFAAGEPVHPKEIASALEGADEEGVVAAVEALSRRYETEGSGLHVEHVAGAYRLATRPDVGATVRQFFRQRNRTRLSPAALETLAIVAYRQPITSPEIQAIRGVDPSGALKSLVERKLLRILGRKKVVGNPLLYGTSRQFLVHFGLNRLEDLPSIEDFDQFLGALETGESSLFPAVGRIEAEGDSEEIELPAGADGEE
ncbi:MAG TPA: SMC-Scp complex subunit ScpB [Candidatus Polarisedimenticolaceae bacterium]